MVIRYSLLCLYLKVRSKKSRLFRKTDYDMTTGIIKGVVAIATEDIIFLPICSDFFRGK